jgi:hypothetical protein
MVRPKTPLFYLLNRVSVRPRQGSRVCRVCARVRVRVKVHVCARALLCTRKQHDPSVASRALLCTHVRASASLARVMVSRVCPRAV